MKQRSPVILKTMCTFTHTHAHLVRSSWQMVDEIAVQKGASSIKEEVLTKKDHENWQKEHTTSLRPHVHTLTRASIDWKNTTKSKTRKSKKLWFSEKRNKERYERERAGDKKHSGWLLDIFGIKPRASRSHIGKVSIFSTHYIATNFVIQTLFKDAVEVGRT